MKFIKEFAKVISPLQKIGASFKVNNKKTPLKIIGTTFVNPIHYFEKGDLHNVKAL